MNRNGITIDDSMAMILESIRERGGTATTSEVKQDVPFTDNEKIKYRFRRLRDAGVLTITDQGIDEDSGRRLPLRVELTAGGEDLVEDHDIHAAATDSVREQQSLDERVGTLEEQMDKVRDDMWQLKSDMQELQEAVERLSSGDGAGSADPDPSEFAFGDE